MSTADTRRTARLTGVAYLGIIVAGILAQFVVRMRLVVPGDPAETARAIADSSTLFRFGIAADVVMIALDVAVAVGFYLLLRTVNRPLAVLAAAFRLVQAAVLAANLSALTGALQFATGGTAVDGIGTAALQGLTLASLQTHALVYDLGLVFFGLSCLALGHVLRSARMVPRAIAIGLSVAGAVYLTGSTVALLAPDALAAFDVAYGLTVAAEVALAGHLTRRGVTVPAPDRAAPIAA